MTTIPDSPTPMDASPTHASSPTSPSGNAVTAMAVRDIHKPQHAAGTPLSKKSVQLIYVDRITSETNLKIIQNQLINWRTIADNNYSEAVKNKDLSKAEVGKIFDNFSIISSLIPGISELESTDSVFAAFDKNGNLQSVAIAGFTAKGGRVDYIATHPENIPIGDKPARFQGGGAAVMTAIIGVTLIFGKQSKNLTLSAYSQAVGFYEKLGFKSLPKASPEHMLTPMVIEPNAMKQTLQSRIDTLIYTHEPENPPQSDTSPENRAM